MEDAIVVIGEMDKVGDTGQHWTVCFLCLSAQEVAIQGRGRSRFGGTTGGNSQACVFSLQRFLMQVSRAARAV